MNRRVLLAMAVAAIAFSTDAAFAGSPNNQYVRIKNIGTSTVNVVAFNGTPSVQPALRALSQNGVTQFILKKGAGTFVVADQAKTTATPLNYNFPRSTYVYLQAKEEAGTVTPSFAPPGTRF